MKTKEVIEELEAIKDGCDYADPQMQSAIKALDIAIKAVKESTWIPCRERLPEMGEAVMLKRLGVNQISDDCLITIQEEGYATVRWADLRDGEWYSSYLKSLMNIGREYEVTAWRPYPAPYEKEARAEGPHHEWLRNRFERRV